MGEFAFISLLKEEMSGSVTRLKHMIMSQSHMMPSRVFDEFQHIDLLGGCNTALVALDRHVSRL